MMLSSGKSPSRNRPEQSGYTLALAVLYSFFLHAAIAGVALFVHFFAIPKAVLLPAYQVKLVGQPKESVPTPVAAPAVAPAPPKKETTPAVKPSPKSKKAVVELKKAAPKKDFVPDLTQQKKAPAPVEQKSSEAAPQKSPAVPAAPAAGPPTTGKKSEGVGSITPQQDFKDSKYSWYIDVVGNRIGQNWNPPPDSKDAKARVIFKINRSGIVTFVHLDKEHSNCSATFEQAAIRAIYASNPFPHFTDEFFQSSLEFTVDLIPAD